MKTFHSFFGAHVLYYILALPLLTVNYDWSTYDMLIN